MTASDRRGRGRTGSSAGARGVSPAAAAYMSSRHKRRVSLRPLANRQAVGFVSRFVLFWALGLLVLSLLPGSERVAVDATVGSIVAFLNLVGVKASSSGNLVLALDVGVKIVPDCTSLMPTLAFGAAVAAFPGEWQPRLLGLAGGTSIIWVFNLVRVSALLAVIRWSPKHFEFVHVHLWQTGTLLAVCALFVGYVLWLPPRASRGSPGGSQPGPPQAQRSPA